MANRRTKNNSKIESLLAILYFGAIFTSVIFSIVLAIVWRYWKDVLDNCIDAHCNCILYATALSRGVRGSDSAWCRAVTFAPVPAVIWACIVGSYHVYRACIRQRKYSSPSRRRSITFGTGETRLPIKRRRSSCCIGIIAIITAIIFIAIAIFVTYGYFSTCTSYKTTVVKYLSASGNLAGMVHDRMTCGSVFDFLDYIQPDPEYIEAKLRRGTYIINTGLLLQLAILSSWLTVLAWVAISVINILLTFKS